MNKFVYLEYKDFSVIGQYISQKNNTVELLDALHITKKRFKNYQYDDITVTIWMNNLLKSDKGYRYKALNGKSFWNTQNSKIYNGIDYVLEKTKKQDMKNLEKFIEQNIL
ncbi:MAG: hypothetical protein KatS3mg002_0926 [Candidatus Woesearchaeota archaeon]|nr:MAG: hypothetical protein KatS3mg002_0926 [Candidatus Woesearchaeota archaeon]